MSFRPARADGRRARRARPLPPRRARGRSSAAQGSTGRTRSTRPTTTGRAPRPAAAAPGRRGSPGTSAPLYLRATYGPGAAVLRARALSRDGLQIMDFAMLHEVLHTMGFVPTCAPHHTRERARLRRVRGTSCTPATSRGGRRARRRAATTTSTPTSSGCRELAESPYLGIAAFGGVRAQRDVRAAPVAVVGHRDASVAHARAGSACSKRRCTAVPFERGHGRLALRGGGSAGTSGDASSAGDERVVTRRDESCRRHARAGSRTLRRPGEVPSAGDGVQWIPGAPAGGAWCGTTRRARSPRTRSSESSATVRRAPSAGYSQGQRLLVVTEGAGRAETIARIIERIGLDDAGRPRAVARERSRSRPRLHARGRLPRALPAGGQARRRRGDRLAGPVLVRRRRRRAHDDPARGDRRGARGGPHGRAEGARPHELRSGVRDSRTT